jgi:hypothetical protein
MLLTSLPDDCLFVISSYLSAPDLLLGFSPTCKACRWAALPSAALAAALPFGVPLHRAASLAARGEIAREASVAASGPAPKARDARKLGDFAFLVALDEGRVWEEARKDGREATLNYVEVGGVHVGHTGGLFDGIKVPIPRTVGPDLWAVVDDDPERYAYASEYGGVHIVVVDKATGQARKLMDGPSSAERMYGYITYKGSDVPGQEFGAASVACTMVTHNPASEDHGHIGVDQYVLLEFAIDHGNKYDRLGETYMDTDDFPPMLAGLFRSMAHPAALDDAVDATVPFAEGMGDEASREAYGQLAREESAVLSAPAYQLWTPPKRKLADFAFLVALDEGRTWEKVKEEGVEAQLRFVEATAEMSPGPPRPKWGRQGETDPTVFLSVPPAVGPAVLSSEGEEHGGVHVVVVDRHTGRARKLVDAPHAEDKGTYFMDMPGQECSAARTDICMQTHDPSEAVDPEWGRSSLDPPKGADQELVLSFIVFSAGPTGAECFSLDVVGIALALAGLFACGGSGGG